MKIKTSELAGAALDWAVAEAKGLAQHIDAQGNVHDAELVEFGCDGSTLLRYSTDWAQGGPIIEREHIALDYYHTPIHPDVQPRWEARHGSGVFEYGPTPLIAAMRCFCASRLGDEVYVPDELL